MNYYSSPTDSKRIEVGEEFVVLYTSTNSDPLIANILYKEKDNLGKIIYAVLDSLIHEKHCSSIGDYDVFGVIATELRLKDKANRRY